MLYCGEPAIAHTTIGKHRTDGESSQGVQDDGRGADEAGRAMATTGMTSSPGSTPLPPTPQRWVRCERSHLRDTHTHEIATRLQLREHLARRPPCTVDLDARHGVDQRRHAPHRLVRGWVSSAPFPRLICASRSWGSFRNHIDFLQKAGSTKTPRLNHIPRFISERPNTMKNEGTVLSKIESACTDSLEAF